MITNQAEIDAAIAKMRANICQTIALAIVGMSSDDAIPIVEFAIYRVMVELESKRPTTAADELRKFMRGFTAELTTALAAMRTAVEDEQGAPRLAQ